MLCAGTCLQAATVSGRVQLPDGAEASRSKVIVRLLKSFGVIPECLMAPWTPNGDFAIPDVPPGNYVLWIATLGVVPGAGQFFGYMPLQVAAADRRDLVVRLNQVSPVDVLGKLAFDNGSSVQPVFIGLQCSIQRGTSAVSNQDGSFILKGLLPGHYMIYVGHSSEWPGPGASGHAVSVKFGDKEVLTTGFDVDGISPPNLRITFQPQSQ